MDDEESVILHVTPDRGSFSKDFLEPLGHPVLVCHGPEWGKACPIVAGTCEMLTAAHGVVFQLDLDRPQHRVILDRYREELPEDVPLWAVVTEDQAERYPELLRGVEVILDDPGAGALDGFAAEVEAADETR